MSSNHTFFDFDKRLNTIELKLHLQMDDHSNKLSYEFQTDSAFVAGKNYNLSTLNMCQPQTCNPKYRYPSYSILNFFRLCTCYNLLQVNTQHYSLFSGNGKLYLIGHPIYGFPESSAFIISQYSLFFCSPLFSNLCSIVTMIYSSSKKFRRKI